MVDVTYRNLRTDAHVELKESNRAWTDCITKNFMPQWLNGAAINIDDVCIEEKARMDAADEAVYSETPFPVKMFTLPTAPSQ